MTLKETQAELRKMRDRLERIALDSSWSFEIETGAACCAWYDDCPVTNGQMGHDGLIECIDEALATVWTDRGTMQPEFAKRLREHKERIAESRHRGRA